MRIVMCSLAVLALVACKPAETPADNAAEANMATDANMAMEANAMAPAAFQINETSWEYTQDGKPITSSIDASGNFVDWSGSKHVDHGTAVVKGDKVCFDSAMDQEGETCWTTSPVEIGQSWESTSDKGEKVTVKRIAYTPVPDAVKP